MPPEENNKEVLIGNRLFSVYVTSGRLTDKVKIHKDSVQSGKLSVHLKSKITLIYVNVMDQLIVDSSKSYK